MHFKNRARSTESTRFSDSKPFLCQKEDGLFYDKNDYIWLAMKWFTQNNYRNPTKREILDGLLLEVKYQYASMKSNETESQRKEVIK